MTAPFGFSFGIPGADPFTQTMIQSQAAQQPQQVAQATPRAGGLPDRSAALSQFAGMRDIESQIGSLEPKRSALMTKMAGGPQVSGSTAMLNGVASVLPLILGMMIAKKKGGAIGGQVGAQLGASLNEKAEKDAKLGYEADKLQLDAYGDQLKELRGQKFGLEKDAYTGEQDDRANRARDEWGAANDPKGAKTFLTVQNNEGTNMTISDDVRKLNQGDRGIIAIADYADKYVKQFAPELLNEPPNMKKDGSFDIPVLLENAKDTFADYLGGVMTKEAAAKAEVGTMLATIIKEISGTANPDPEYRRLARNITGDGVLLPAVHAIAFAKIRQTADRRQQEIADRTELDDTQNRYPSRVGEVVASQRERNRNRPISEGLPAWMPTQSAKLFTDEPSVTQASPQETPPATGMKKQVNPVTGEVREVPR